MTAGPRRALTAPIVPIHDRAVRLLAAPLTEGAALLLTRAALAGVFWRAGRSKVEAGSLMSISDATHYLFANDYAGVPLPPELAAHLAVIGEHLFPALLILGLATRLSAAALLLMTLIIQIFVYPEAWWSVHMLWCALAAVLMVRGGGLFALDAVIGRRRRRS